MWEKCKEQQEYIVAMRRELHEIAHGSLRLTFSENNKPEEIEYILSELPGIINYLREMSPVWDELEQGQRPHLI